MSNEDLAKLPRVDRVAGHPSLEAARKRLGAEAVTALARRAIDAARRAVREGAACPSVDEAAREVLALAEATLSSRTRPVINATGVVLHTNLGRAPLASAAVRALAATAGRYASIELDLATGKRGPRGAFGERALAGLAGAESALVVNNCAAAVLLVLSSIAFGKSVVVSRGELIEIGGGFRVPEVCARSGARLVEVGTTNKTRLDDYDRRPRRDARRRRDPARAPRQFPAERLRRAPRPRRALPPSPTPAACRWSKDLGGGALVDLGPLGLAGEPTVRSCVAAGADVVCFSTDKALGGPQGGALVGAPRLVEKARRDPLARALRLGRLPLVALEATLAAYLEGGSRRRPRARRGPRHAGARPRARPGLEPRARGAGASPPRSSSSPSRWAAALSPTSRCPPRAWPSPSTIPTPSPRACAPGSPRCSAASRKAASSSTRAPCSPTRTSLSSQRSSARSRTQKRHHEGGKAGRGSRSSKTRFVLVIVLVIDEPSSFSCACACACAIPLTHSLG